MRAIAHAFARASSLSLGLALLICWADAPSIGALAAQRPDAGTLERNKALVRRWIEDGFNKQNVAIVDELFAESFAVNGTRIGRAGLKQSMSRYFAALPDLHVTITDLVAEGGKVTLWYTVQGTQKGEFEGIPPTCKPVNWVGADLFSIERDPIIDGRFLSDSLGLLRQLGATRLPEPPPT